ncbi:MAG: hypothetical protein BWY79_01126 [Actinobacteria bacterium ADurb.Bin444]|nr:MAG: hypothetical protein BWY79_01126 [Actinobacteria bacterium ADurb.Bin444]
MTEPYSCCLKVPRSLSATFQTNATLSSKPCGAMPCLSCQPMPRPTYPRRGWSPSSRLLVDVALDWCTLSTVTVALVQQAPGGGTGAARQPE